MKKNKILTSLARTLLLLLLLLPDGKAFAQQGLPTLPQVYRKLYAQALLHRREDRGLQLADSMKNMALRSRNRVAEMYALNIPVHYWFYHKQNPQAFEKAVQCVKDKAMQYRMPTFYYNAVANKVYYMLNAQQYRKALKYITSEQEFAKNNSHPYGIFVGYNILGVVYRQTGEYKLALDNFRKAVEYGRRTHQNLSMEYTYREMARCYRHMMQYDRLLALTYEDEGRQRDSIAESALIANRCYALYALGRDREFEQYYKRFCKIDEKVYENFLPVAKAVEVFHRFVTGKEEEGWDIQRKMRSETEKLLVAIIGYHRQGDYLKMGDCIRRFEISQMAENKINISEEAAELNALMAQRIITSERDSIEYANQRLALTHAQLSLHNTSLELNRSKDASRLAQMEADRNLLSYNNQKLRFKQLQDSLAFQKSLHDMQKQRSASQSVVLFSVVIILCLFAISVLIGSRRVQAVTAQRKETNRQLLQTRSDLEVAKDAALESDRLKTIFIQNMNHEIRTPLNAIVGFSGVLSDMLDNITTDEKNDLNRRILENSELLSTLVNDILDLTSIESGKYVMKKEQTSINQLCRQAMEQVSHRVAAGIDFRFDSSLDDDDMVTTDILRTIQVITNMLTNAIKNTLSGSIVLAVSTQVRSGMVTFTVTDTGRGVPTDKMDHIFERFHKLDTFAQGTGLGLYISRVIATKLQGYIDIDRTYTKGARFAFSIPQ